MKRGASYMMPSDSEQHGLYPTPPPKHVGSPSGPGSAHLSQDSISRLYMRTGHVSVPSHSPAQILTDKAGSPGQHSPPAQLSPP